MCLTPCSTETVISIPIFSVTNEKLRRVAALQRLSPGVVQVTCSQPETCNAKPSRLTLAHSLAHIFQRELDLAREDGWQHTAQGEARRARNPGDGSNLQSSPRRRAPDCGIQGLPPAFAGLGFNLTCLGFRLHLSPQALC